MKKILITGPHGFVGQNLINCLHHDYTLYGLSQSAVPIEGIEQVYTWTDLEQGRIPEVEAIVHLAGKAHDTKNQTDAQVYTDVNYGLTVKVYDYFRRHGEIRRFVFFSSVKAAADRVLGDVLTEDARPTPAGPYGESKLQAEQYILGHTTDDGRRVYILRPCMMHGPGNKGNLNLLFKVVKTGLPWPLGAFENRRSFAAIENVCYVTESLLAGNVPSGIYNLADDDALSTNELIEVICVSLGKKPVIWKFGKGAMSAMARLGDKIHLPLNTERLGKLTENYVVDNRKIKNALGIAKMPVSTKDGLAFTIQSFQEK